MTGNIILPNALSFLMLSPTLCRIVCNVLCLRHLCDGVLLSKFDKYVIISFTCCLPICQYAVFNTPHMKHPVEDYMKLREEIATEWLPGSGYTLRNAPELGIYHWYPDPDKNKRYIEIRSKGLALK